MVNRVLKLALLLSVPSLVWLMSSVSLQAAAGRAPSAAELPAQQRITALIRQLGDEQYPLRKQAQEELSKFGAEAFDQLVAAQDDDDIEIAARARYLVHHIRVEWVQDNDSIQVKDLLKDYDNQDSEARLGCMRQLAALNDVGLQALCRLIRFEKSPLLAKQGALLILAAPEPLAASWPPRARQIVDNLRGSTRTAARWLRAYVRSHEDPEASLVEWNKLVDEELVVAEADAPQVETQVQTRLLRWQADLLLSRKHRPQALDVMQKLLARQSDDVEGLIDFVDWLVAKEAWEVVDATATRFERTFAADRSLLYTLAQAQKVHGNEAAAQRYAQQAFDLAANPDELDARLDVARSLRYRGMLAWSEREYKQVMSVGVAGSEEVLRAGFDLSEMLHDLERDGDAADVLHKIVDQTKGNGELQQRLNELGHPAKTLRARMHFFAACQFLAKGDHVHQVEELDLAIEADATDADALIAVYHLPDQSTARRKQTADLIREAAEQCENDLADQPEQPGLYNQYAWLISNTEGDLDRALKYAQKAVELAEIQRASVMDNAGIPNVERLFDLQTAELTDTLAHCYAAKKDYAAAVRCQTRAVELDGHSLQIQHAMEQFRKQLADSKATKP